MGTEKRTDTIIVAQFYTENIEYGIYSEKINRQYCEKHGYSYIVETDSTKINTAIGDRHPTWYKPLFLLEVFERTDAEWVLFLDADAIVCDFKRRIEEFVDEEYKIIASDDIGHHSDFNAGVLLVKNDPEVKEFLKAWFESGANYTGLDAKELNIGTLNDSHDKIKGLFKSALWHDQTCLTLLSRTPKYKGYFKSLDRKIFNHGELKQGNFIFHAYTKGHHPYRTLDITYRTLLPEEYSSMESKNIIVYHIFSAGNYLDVVAQQLDRIKQSGLYDWCDKIHATCINLEGNFEDVENLLSNYSKVELNKFTSNDYEYEGIKAVWKYGQQYNGNILYLHTKGVTNRYKDKNTDEVSERKSLGVDIWKELLEYYLIDEYETCIEKLKEVAQVGVTNVNGWWWGNFWWATLENIRIQTEPGKGDRWSYEAWLNNGRNPSKHEFYHYNWNPYFTTLPVDFYRGELKGDVSIIKAEYGTLGIQQDEGTPAVERKTIDVTDIIQENFKANQNTGLHIMVDNGTMKEDPYFGVVKTLEVEIEINNQRYYIAAREGEPLQIQF